MRVRRLDLIRYGCFTERSLEFAAPGNGLHVIHGPNEAGKSTALRALSALLFGVPHQSQDVHLHAGRDLLVGAVLELQDGSTLELVRRKGRKNTLRSADEQPLDDSELLERLGGITREVFERMFGFDHTRLVAGGRELLEEGGRLQEALFGAAAGLSGLREVIRDLDSEAQELFKPAGQHPPLNRALREHREARAQLTRSTLRPSEYERLQRDLAESETALEGTRTAYAKAQSELSHRSALLGALPDLQLRDELHQRLLNLGDVPVLAEEAKDQRIEAENEIRGAAKQLAKLGDERERLDSELAGIRVPEQLISAGAHVDALASERGVYEESARQRADLVAQRSTVSEATRELLRSLPGSPDLDALDSNPLDAATETRIRERIREGRENRARTAEVEARLRVTEVRLGELASQLGELPGVVDPKPLRLAANAGRRLGDLEERQRQRVVELEQLDDDIERRLSALPYPQPDATTAASLPVPAAPTLEHFDERFRELEASAERLDERDERIDVETHELERQRARLEGLDALPTAQEVTGARRERDQIWRQIRSIWLETATSGPPPQLLAGLYEAAGARADDLSDKRFEAHERIVQLRGVRDQLDDRERERERLKRERDALRSRLEALQSEWQRCWAACELAPGSPREMREFCERQQELTHQVAARQRLMIQIASERELLARHVETLRTALQDAGSQSNLLPNTLTGLLDTTDAESERLDRMRTQRIRLESELDGAQREQALATQELEQLELQRCAWREAWLECTTALGLESDASPDEADAVLSKRSELRTQARELRQLDQRVAAHDAKSREFVIKLDALVVEVCTDLDARSPLEASALLIERLQTARKLAQRRADLERRRRETDIREAELERDIQSARTRLEELASRAGVETSDELEEAERRSREHERLTAELEEAEKRLLRSGRSLAELAEAAARVDEVTLRQQVAALDDRVAALLEERETLIHTTRDHAHALDALKGRESAAEAASRAEASLAEISKLTAEYARKRVASLVLGREMRRYAEANQGPVLQRASDFFRQITLMRYVGLASDFASDDSAILVCQRPDGTRVGVEGLSEGTRDQLYLCLRLAALEHHMQTNEPLPLVVDDVLMTFDDARSRATLELFGELGTRHQLLFFTHHSHLVELARDALPADRLHVYELTALAAP